MILLYFKVYLFGFELYLLGFMLSWLYYRELDRLLSQLRQLYSSVEVSSELRGWNWSNDLLSPPVENVYFGVSELANRYCSTFRDVYLRRVAGVFAPITFKTVRGWVYHALCVRSASLVKSTLYSHGLVRGIEFIRLMEEKRDDVVESLIEEYRVKQHLTLEEVEQFRSDLGILFDYFILQAASRLDVVLSEVRYARPESIINRVVPQVSEKLVDGRLIGLSGELRIDVMLDNRVIIDIKTGDVHDFHKYALAGYALAIESDLEIPIDYGLITYLSVRDGYVKINNKMYFIGDELRREFIDIRDEAFNVLSSGEDPGMPEHCPEYCIYYSVCRGGGL